MLYLPTMAELTQQPAPRLTCKQLHVLLTEKHTFSLCKKTFSIFTRQSLICVHTFFHTSQYLIKFYINK
jgi:hypothetical protein